MSRKFIYALSNLVGIAVGVGIFGIPFSFAKASFLVGFAFLVVIAVLSTILNLAYGEIILRTTDAHQFTGYARKYLGKLGQKAATFTFVFSIYGALLAYVIISGDFLFNIFSGSSPFVFSLIFAFVLSIIASLNLKAISGFELGASLFFVAVVGLLLFLGLPHIQTENLGYFINEFWFLPYGVLLFAFSSVFSIPVIRNSLEGEDKKLKNVIIYAMIIIAALYLTFSLTVTGISGDVTSPDAISGLFPFLGQGIVLLGSLFGIVAISASFVILSKTLVEIFSFDYNFRKFPSWLLAIAPPIILFISGLRAFIDVISLVGAVAFGLAAILIMLMHLKSKNHGDRIPEYALHLPLWTNYVIMALFGVGIIYALAFF